MLKIEGEETMGSPLTGKAMAVAVAGSGLAQAFAGAPAMVQTSPANDTTALQEVVVTAQKHEEFLQKVPIAITAIGSEALASRDLSEPVDILRGIPGVSIQSTAGAANISIRGVGTNSITGDGEPSAAVHVNGVYMTQMQAMDLAQDDLQRVEVLHGPQGTLYGRNSTAGVINYITTAPTDGFTAGGSALYGNYKHDKITAYVSGPMTDRIRGRIFLASEDRDGYVLNLANRQRLDDLHRLSARGALDADITGFWRAELRVTYGHELEHGPVYKPTDPRADDLPPGTRVSFNPFVVDTPTGYLDIAKVALGSLRNIWSIGDFTLTSLTGYTWFDNRGISDSLGTTPPEPTNRKLEDHTFSEELNLSGQTGKLKWLTGLYYLRDRFIQNQIIDISTTLGLPLNSFVPHISAADNHRSYSAFADGTLDVTDRLRIFSGARVLHEQVDQDLSFILPGTPPTALCEPVSAPEHLSATNGTGRAGLQYDVLPDSMAYAQYSHGYKAGGFSTSTCFNEFKPERVDALEVGLKNELLDHRLRLNVDAYYNDIHDLQIQQSTSTGLPIVNAPKSHVFGAELDTLFVVTRWLSLDAAGSFMSSRYDEFINGDTSLDPTHGQLTPGGLSLRGIHLSYAPAASATVGAEYGFPVSEGVLRLRGETYVTSRYNVREFNLPWTQQSGYALFNTYLSYTWPGGRYSLRLAGKNLSNRVVLGGVGGNSGTALGTYLTPRTYSMEFSFND
jgi:iron complex outermembrane receptor protein